MAGVLNLEVPGNTLDSVSVAIGGGRGHHGTLVRNLLTTLGGEAHGYHLFGRIFAIRGWYGMIKAMACSDSQDVLTDMRRDAKMSGQLEMYTYPLWFRILYGGLVSKGSIFILIAMMCLLWYFDALNIYIAIAWLLLIALGIVTEYNVLSKVPMLITICDGVISLYRLGRRTDISLTALRDVNTGVRTPFSIYPEGVAKVSYDADGQIRTFYIWPYISSYVRLAALLSEAAGKSRSEAKVQEFAVPPTAVLFFRFVVIGWTGMLIGFGALWAATHWKPPIVIPVVVTGGSLLLWLMRNYSRKFAIRVILGNDTLIATPLFGNPLVLSRSQAISGTDRVMRWPGTIGIELRFQGRRTIYIDAAFVDYHVLVQELDRWIHHLL